MGVYLYFCPEVYLVREFSCWQGHRSPSPCVVSRSVYDSEDFGWTSSRLNGRVSEYEHKRYSLIPSASSFFHVRAQTSATRAAVRSASDWTNRPVNHSKSGNDSRRKHIHVTAHTTIYCLLQSHQLPEPSSRPLFTALFQLHQCIMRLTGSRN